MKVCKSCREIKSLEDYSVVNREKMTRRADCKPCQTQRVILIKAEKQPHNYLTCEDCGKLMGKTVRHKPVIICRYCKSNNLEEYGV